MARDYVSELTTIRNAINEAMASGGLVSMKIGDQSYTLGINQLQARESYLEGLIRRRNGGGRSIVGEPT